MKPNVEVCRIFKPQDANLYGIVHGGTILQLISEASYISCYKHLNQEVDEIVIPVLCRIEHTDFLAPAMIGDLGVARAKVVFTSNRSARIYVEIFSGTIVGHLKLISYSILWYNGCKIDPVTKNFKPIQIPQVETDYLQEFAEESRIQYEDNKKNRENDLQSEHTNVDFNKLTLTFNYIGISSNPREPSDCTTAVHLRISSKWCSKEGFLLGGFLLKKMDEVGAICSFKFSNQYFVTGCIEALDFHFPAKINDILILVGRVVFSSVRSVDVQVLVFLEDFFKEKCRKLICSSNYVYVLRPSKTPLPALPSLKMESDEQKVLYEQAEKRYKIRKNIRSPNKYSPIFEPE